MLIGCNYWAYNAGIRMWRDWDIGAIRRDLTILSEHGVNTIRVFPTWDDFQPVKEYFGANGNFAEYRMKDGTLPKNKSFLDETILDRFSEFCDICESLEIKLIVGLLTGWMSGRLFVPDALERRNLYSDPVALLFEQRFVRGFVKKFRDRSIIYAWDLGNECNCMSKTDSRETAANWTAIISASIRAYDDTRPIISGMHGLTQEGIWSVYDQGEFTDVLTTHPYPVFVPHCRNDKIMSQRTLLHATCETKYYAELSGKPCLVEELGTLGPVTASDETAADFLRVNLFSSWANNAEGVLWWCANDQNNLSEPPYAWMMCERELGMIDSECRPKPVLYEMKKFSDFLKKYKINPKPAKYDGVCISTLDQDQWGIAYMSYILAKQAGVNIRFSSYKTELPESKIYLLPSVAGMCVMAKEKYYELLERVKNGAVLYISNDNAYLTDFENVTGLKVIDSDESVCEGSFSGLKFKRERNLYLKPVGAQIIEAEEDGNPIFTVHSFGKGKVYYLNFPLEKMLLNEKEAFSKDYYKIYNKVFDTDSNPALGITDHGDYIVVINYTENTEKCPDFPGFELICGKKEIEPFRCAILKKG